MSYDTCHVAYGSGLLHLTLQLCEPQRCDPLRRPRRADHVRSLPSSRAVRCGAVRESSSGAAKVLHRRTAAMLAVPHLLLHRTAAGRLTVRPICRPFTEYTIRQVRADAVPRHDPVVGAGAARRALGRLQPRPRCVAQHRIRRSIIRCCSATTLHR